MFLDNKHSRKYFSIIAARQANPIEGYVERHHITPSSLGGSNDRSNIVRLTAREHWVCHLLLPKMLEGPAKFKMMAAIGRMAVSNKNGFRHNSRTYQIAKRMLSEAASLLGKGRVCSAETKKKISDKTKNLDPAVRAKISDSTRVKSSTMREKLRVVALSRTAEHYEKISAAQKGRPRSLGPQPIWTCSQCGLEAVRQTISRFHNENCKSITRHPSGLRFHP
jgi:hypothetical protein